MAELAERAKIYTLPYIDNVDQFRWETSTQHDHNSCSSSNSGSRYSGVVIEEIMSDNDMYDDDDDEDEGDDPMGPPQSYDNSGSWSTSNSGNRVRKRRLSAEHSESKDVDVCMVERQMQNVQIQPLCKRLRINDTGMRDDE